MIDFSDSSDHDPWKDCTYEGSELATLRHAARMTFAQKIAWLEEAQRVADMFKAARQKMGLKTIYSDGRIES